MPRIATNGFRRADEVLLGKGRTIRFATFRESAVGYMEAVRDRNLAPKTLEGYGQVVDKIAEILGPRGLPPHRLRERHMRLIESKMPSPFALRTASVCLGAMGSPVLPRFTIPPRTHVRWLEPWQADRVMKTALDLGPPWSVATHCELELGFRRVSVMRARPGDFMAQRVYVRGKPTPRRDYTVWPGRRTQAMVIEAAEYREAKGFDGMDVLLPARWRGGRVGPYSENGLDGVMGRVSRESGVRFSNHDLRRTFGRSLWKAGVKVEVISPMMGHLSIDQTIEYLGIRESDQEEAMSRLSEWQSGAKGVPAASSVSQL